MTKARDDESTGQPSQGVKATGVLKVRGDKLHLLHHKRVRKIRTKHSQAMAEMRYEQAKLRRENAMLKRQLVTIRTSALCARQRQQHDEKLSKFQIDGLKEGNTRYTDALKDLHIDLNKRYGVVERLLMNFAGTGCIATVARQAKYLEEAENQEEESMERGDLNL